MIQSLYGWAYSAEMTWIGWDLINSVRLSMSRHVDVWLRIKTLGKMDHVGAISVSCKPNFLAKIENKILVKKIVSEFDTCYHAFVKKLKRTGSPSRNPQRILLIYCARFSPREITRARVARALFAGSGGIMTPPYSPSPSSVAHIYSKPWKMLT